MSAPRAVIHRRGAEDAEGARRFEIRTLPADVAGTLEGSRAVRLERLDFEKVSARADDAHLRRAAPHAAAGERACGPQLAVDEDVALRVQFAFDRGQAADESEARTRRPPLEPPERDDEENKKQERARQKEKNHRFG